MLPHDRMAALSDRFRRFGENECASSPLYQKLCFGIAADAAVLALTLSAPPDQPAPNLLFGAVRYLLAADENAPLNDLYGRAAAGETVDDPYPQFRAFCLTHADAVSAIIATRRVQTNEVRRTLFLVAGLAEIARRTSHVPLRLIEIGASAGLNLLWQRFAYDFGGRAALGQHDAPLTLRTDLRAGPPPLGSAFPRLSHQSGLDLNPLDVCSPDDRRWLRALIWPEHTERIATLNIALQLAQQHPPAVLAGDALALLPDLLAAAAPGEPVVIFHSFVLYQFTQTMRDQLDTLLSAHHGPVYRLGVEWSQTSGVLALTAYAAGDIRADTLAFVEPHGRWMEWVAD